MFYSHEILTSREGGVATVWLVATLGSKSNMKKVNRKAILEVDIQKTCDIIIAPEAPMALRLQSNLLYGVSRVYLQQCGYVLSDAQIAQSNMRQLLKSIRTSGLDSEAGKARPDQLIIQDDPAFLPELAMPGLDIDLSALDISTDDSSRRSSLLSPHSQRSSISSTQQTDESVLGLVIPSSGTGGGGSIGGFVLPGDDRSSAQRTSRLRSMLGEEEDVFDLEPGFTFDDEGDIVFHDAGEQAQPGSATRPVSRIGSDSAASARVRQEIEEGMQAGQFEFDDQMNLDLDIDLPRQDDNRVALPEAEAFPPRATQPPVEPQFLRSSSSAPQDSSETAEAPARRRHAGPKPLPWDAQRSLRNNDLASWNNNYITNMADATHIKQQHKAPNLAKKNAAHWVYGFGIGGVGLGLGGSQFPSPLDMFAGDQLMTALTGIEPTTRGRKRSHTGDEGGDSDTEGRRVRARDDDDQIARGEQLGPRDDDTTAMDLGIQGDDADIEIGRHAVPALEDYSSQMPWNTSASRGGSIALSAAAGFPSSVGQPAVPSPHDRRRLTSASPLVGRGHHRLSSLDLPIQEAEDDFGDLGGADLGVSEEIGVGVGEGGGEADASEDFEYQLYGPAAGVTTQQAAESQWVRATLDAESRNLLDFVKGEITNRRREVEVEGEAGMGREISFEELLPPNRHTRIVAAQALHHVLALATKGLIVVRQDVVEYGPIVVGVGEGI